MLFKTCVCVVFLAAMKSASGMRVIKKPASMIQKSVNAKATTMIQKPMKQFIQKPTTRTPSMKSVHAKPAATNFKPEKPASKILKSVRAKPAATNFKPVKRVTKKSVSTKSYCNKLVSTGTKKSGETVGEVLVREAREARKARDQEIRPCAHPGWNGLEIPGRLEPLLPPGRHVRNIPFQDGVYQPAQTFVSGGGAGGDWTSDGMAPMAFTVWLSCWTSQQLPDGLMVMKKDGGREGKLTFVYPATECNAWPQWPDGDDSEKGRR